MINNMSAHTQSRRDTDTYIQGKLLYVVVLFLLDIMGYAEFERARPMYDEMIIE